jgi:hypothetical protein
LDAVTGIWHRPSFMVFPAFTPLYNQHSEKSRRCQTFLPARTSLPQCGQYVFLPVKNIMPR